MIEVTRKQLQNIVVKRKVLLKEVNRVDHVGEGFLNISLELGYEGSE